MDKRPDHDDLVLDANAVAGELMEMFGRELTDALHQCAHCGHQAAMGTLRAWVHGPGVVLRCSVCQQVVVRWTRTEAGVHVDMRGAAFVAMSEGPV